MVKALECRDGLTLEFSPLLALDTATTDAVPLPKSAPRADALLFVESKGPMSPALPGGVSPTATASRPDQTFHGRY